MRSITVIAASAALGLAAFAYAGAPPEETGPPQASPAQQPATPPPADGSTAPPASDPAGSAQPSTAAAPASGPDNTRLASITPAGMSPQEACTGFQNSTDCAAVLHVAQNLNIPFADLKSKLASGTKLDAAITEMKPDANAQAEVAKALQQARADANPAPSG